MREEGRGPGGGAVREGGVPGQEGGGVGEGGGGCAGEFDALVVRVRCGKGRKEGSYGVVVVEEREVVACFGASDLFAVVAAEASASVVGV